MKRNVQRIVMILELIHEKLLRNSNLFFVDNCERYLEHLIVAIKEDFKESDNLTFNLSELYHAILAVDGKKCPECESLKEGEDR